LSGYPSDFPIHLVELCWDEIQTEFESCAIYTSELEMDEALVFGTRVSQKFLQGFPKQLVMKEINRQDPSGFTPLISLTQKSGFLERSKKGGKKGEADRFEYPIHQVAAWFGKHNPVYLLVYLLKHCKAKPNAVDNRGFSPLHHAVASSSPLVVQKLLKEGKPDPNLQNHDGNAPIHLALGCWIKMYLLLEEGALPNIANKQKETPLHLFFTKGMKVKSWKGLPQVCSNDIALLLLRHPKCDPNAQNKDGETALHVLFNSSRASHFVKKSAVVVKEILKRGGDPTIEDHRGRTAYQLALNRFKSDGYSALFHLDCWMKMNAPDKLIEARRSVSWPHDLVDRDGNTLLHLLMQEVLRDRRAFPQYTYDPAEMCTDLDFSCSFQQEFVPFQKNLKFIQESLDARIDVNAKNIQGQTPLHAASNSFFVELARLLVSRGANVNVHNNNLETPLFSAVVSLKKLEEERLEEIRLLEIHAARQRLLEGHRNRHDRYEDRPVVPRKENKRRQRKRQTKRNIQRGREWKKEVKEEEEKEEEERKEGEEEREGEEIANGAEIEEKEEEEVDEEIQLCWEQKKKGGEEEEEEESDEEIEEEEKVELKEEEEVHEERQRENRTLLKLEEGYKMIEFLLSVGADPNVETRDNETALHVACALPDPSRYHVVSRLVKSGAKPNCVDFKGRTPLMITCDDSDIQEDVLDLLIQAGTDVAVVDNTGMDCLYRLVSNPDAPASIIEKVLQMDVVDFELPIGKTILRQAIDCLLARRERDLWEKEAAIIELLVAKGACARTRLKYIERTSLEYFVGVASRDRKKHQDWAIFGPIFLRIGLSLGEGGVSENEKKFVFDRIGRDVFSPTLNRLWEGIQIFNDFVKPAKR